MPSGRCDRKEEKDKDKGMGAIIRGRYQTAESGNG